MVKSACALVFLLAWAASAVAQDPPPPIGPAVVDVRATFPKLPDDTAVAESRGLVPSDLPGRGIGIDAAAHVYVVTWHAVTFGIGGQLTLARSHSGSGTSQDAPHHAVSERFTSLAPQLSFNFGTGDGWSYISGGVGLSRWSIVPDGASPRASDEAWLPAFNYGGGARWFMKRRVAFHVDVRMHTVGRGAAGAALPASPRSRLLVVGAGASVKFGMRK